MLQSLQAELLDYAFIKVWPIGEYRSSIFDMRNTSCIEAIQNWACPYFMAVGKYTPKTAVQGECQLQLKFGNWLGGVGPDLKIWRITTLIKEPLTGA